MQVYGKKTAVKAPSVRQRVTVCESECYSQIVYLCLFSFMAACHFCFPDLSVGEWFMWTAPQIVLVITQNSPGMQYCKCVEGCAFAIYVHKCLFMHLCAHEICLLERVHSFLRVHVVWVLTGSSPPMVGLSLPDGWSQPVSERWQLAGLASPGQGSGSCPLTAPDSSWWVTSPPLPPPMSLHHGNSWFTEKSMMSHSVL